MYIGQIMHTNLVTAPPETTLVEARELIDAHQIEHLLIVNKKGKLVGMVSDRDLKQNWASPPPRSAPTNCITCCKRWRWR